MKVICIDAGKSKVGKADATNELKEGCVYDVFYHRVDALGILSYDVGKSVLYGAWRFVTISEIDEKEFERNYQKELI